MAIGEDMRVCEGCGKELVLKNRHGRMECWTKFMERRFCGRACYTNLQLATRHIRVWKYITKTDGCWIWDGCLNGNGYGVYCNILAHRYVWELHNGPIPLGLSALHKCDNPRCVNPEHIFIGTKADNNKDMDAKGRRVTLRGENTRQAKFKDAEVVEIKIQLSEGITLSALAARYNVAKGTIANISRGTNWRHIKVPSDRVTDKIIARGWASNNG